VRGHRWAESGTGLGRRFDCGDCGSTVFSYEEPVLNMDGSALFRRPLSNPRWEESEVLPDCDLEKVRKVMEG